MPSEVEPAHCEDDMNAVCDSAWTQVSLPSSRPSTPMSYTQETPELSPIVPSPYPAPPPSSSIEGKLAKAKASADFIVDVYESPLLRRAVDTTRTGPRALDSDHGPDRQPVTEDLFDSGMDMKHTAVALTPDKGRVHLEEDLKMTSQALSHGRVQTLTPAMVPLPPSPYPVSGDFDLPVRLRSQLSNPVLINPSQDELEYVHGVEARSTAANAPAFINPSASTNSKKKKKKLPKRKKPLKQLSPSKKDSHAPGDPLGNDGQEYSYSQIVSGERQVDTLKEGLKEANVNAKVETPETAEQHYRTSSQKKGVWWAQENEIIGESEPPYPLLKRAAPLFPSEELQGEEESAYGSPGNSAPASPRDTEIEAQDLRAGEPWDDKAKITVAKHLKQAVENIEHYVGKENEA